MSNNLRTSKSPHRDVRDAHVTSYVGGSKGRMLQVHQYVSATPEKHTSPPAEYHMDEDMVRDLIQTMQIWLGES